MNGDPGLGPGRKGAERTSVRKFVFVLNQVPFKVIRLCSLIFAVDTAQMMAH